MKWKTRSRCCFHLDLREDFAFAWRRNWVHPQNDSPGNKTQQSSLDLNLASHRQHQKRHKYAIKHFFGSALDFTKNPGAEVRALSREVINNMVWDHHVKIPFAEWKGEESEKGCDDEHRDENRYQCAGGPGGCQGRKTGENDDVFNPLDLISQTFLTNTSSYFRQEICVWETVKT